MTAATKVSSCVDCGTPIIGERPRCPACHDFHAARMVGKHEDDETGDTTTAPRSRQRVRVANGRTPGLFAAWLVVIEVLGFLALALALLVKGCS